MILSERGMTLAEILAAVAIVGIGLVGLMTVIPISTYGVQEGKQVSTATFLAEQRLEEVRAARWASTPKTPNGNDPDCLGVGVEGAPTSLRCVRTTPTACSDGTTCTTFTDEASVAGYPGYSRIVRIEENGPASSGCTDPAAPEQRLVTVTVSYRPLSATGATASATKDVTLQMLVAKRC